MAAAFHRLLRPLSWCSVGPVAVRKRRYLLVCKSTRLALRGLTTLIGVGVVAITFLVSSAQADLVNLNPCNGSPLSQPFLPWVDPAWYELAPGGDFESDGWTLSGGAQRVAGSEPYAATGSLGASSVSLVAGSSADSPLTCVDAAYPSIRFFIAGTGTVAAGLMYDGMYIPAGVAVAVDSWEPTPVMVTDSAIAGLLSGGSSADVSVRITGLSGDPQIDDVFIDPWNRG